MGLEWGETGFDGESDYAPFLEAGIPSGGLYTGDGETKSDGEAARFGGEGGRAFDFCYHRACDDLDNISVRGLEEMTDAAAAVVVHYATAVPDGRDGIVPGSDPLGRRLLAVSGRFLLGVLVVGALVVPAVRARRRRGCAPRG